MKAKALFLTPILSAFFTTIVFSQAPEIEWQNTIGGSAGDHLYSLQLTSDGGYILGGYSYSGISGDKTEALLSTDGWYDYWVLKLNSSGAIEWQNTIGGDSDDRLYSIQQTSDNGYILGGYSSSGISSDKTEASLGLTDYWVVKLNSTGDIEWQNTIGGKTNDNLRSIQQTFDGGYILGGYSNSVLSGDKTEASLGSSDYWIVKLNNTGGIEWQNTIGGGSTDNLYSIQQTSDGGYILGGSSLSGISGDKTEAFLGGVYFGDYWIVKLNSSGGIEWQNTIGGSSDDALYSIRQTSDGGYILGGYSDSDISGDKTEANQGGSSTYDYWVVKLNNNGSIEWQNTIGGNKDDYLDFIQQTTDNGYILGGYSSSGNTDDKTEAKIGDADCWVVKLNSTGNIEWQNTIGGSAHDDLTCIQQTSDGGYAFGGTSSSGISGDKTEAALGSYDYWIVKLYPEVLTCQTPAAEFASNITATAAKTNWNVVNTANKYKVRYKPSDTNIWTTVSTTNNYKKLKELSPLTEYDWQVKSVCTDAGLGNSDWSSTQNFITDAQRLSSEQEISFEVYPNPFTSSTTLTFTIEEASDVTMQLFDMTGRRLQTIMHENVEAGEHEMNFIRHQLPQGIYMLRMTAHGEMMMRKMVIE